MVCTCATANVSSDIPSTITLKRLQSELRESQLRIHSVSVAYRSSGYSKDYPNGSYVYQKLVAKAPSSVLRISAHGHNALDWRDDPLQQWGYITQKQFYNYNPVNKTYKYADIKENSPLPNKMTTSFFFMSTGIWPLDSRPPYRPGGRPYTLREVAESSEYHLRPRLEKVGNYWCHVLEHGQGDRLWIDTERDCALLARESDDLNNGYLMQRYELVGHREITDGVWLPDHIRTIQYDSTAGTAEGRKRKIKDGVITLSEVQVNNVDDQVFEFGPPPGSLRIGQHVRPIQTQPLGTIHLDNIVTWLVRYVPPKQRLNLATLYQISTILFPIFAWSLFFYLKFHKKTPLIE
jgi:hypothetical protein